MKSIDNIFLPVDDLQSARDFYLNIGLPVKFDFSDKGMIAFSIGDNEPAIILKDVNKFPEAKPTTWFVVDDVKKHTEILKNHGVNFLSEPFHIKTGTAVEFDDPFGNRLGITDYSR